MKIDLWMDRENKKINPVLFSDTAEALAKELADDCRNNKKRLNKISQIRKFYDEVIRLNMASKGKNADWDSILPMINMIIAKTAYAKGRNLISNNFLLFIKSEVVSSELKKGFDEVEDFTTNKIQLSDANDFLSELKSAY